MTPDDQRRETTWPGRPAGGRQAGARVSRGIGALAFALAVACAIPAEARSHPAGRVGVPEMVRRVRPAVVSITTRQIEHNQFNQTVSTRGLGSGFIVDRRGYILTNYHVVEGAEQIKVTLSDGRVFRATLAGADTVTDLAVLKVEGGHLPVVPLGDSSRLAVGETVVAIGSPLWIEGGPTVTAGIVSALGRTMEQEGLPILHDLVQTDAAINQGNSGGPLLNLAGAAIGINTALIPSAHGIGFAIAINTAKRIMTELIAGRPIVRPSLDLQAVSVTPQIAYANDLAVERGALVVRVDPGGAAEVAGVEAGDVVTAVAGRPVKNLRDLHDALFGHRPGATIELTLWREGRKVTVWPVLGGSR
jgi:S1-C subfamily serine protease